MPAGLSYTAARIAEFNEEWTTWYTPPRRGMEVEPLLIALGMLVLAVAGLGIGYLLAGETGAMSGLVGVGLILVGLLVRIWPVFSVPVFFKGKFRWSPAARGLVWQGTGLERAWRVTRLPQAKLFVNRAFLLPLLGLVLPLLSLRIALGSNFFINLLFYGCSLPYLSILNLRLTALLLSAEEDLKQGKR